MISYDFKWQIDRYANNLNNIFKLKTTVFGNRDYDVGREHCYD